MAPLAPQVRPISVVVRPPMALPRASFTTRVPVKVAPATSAAGVMSQVEFVADALPAVKVSGWGLAVAGAAGLMSAVPSWTVTSTVSATESVTRAV